MKMTQTLPAGSATLTNAENITNKERLSYGASDFACNIANGMVGTYLMYYYTDVFGLAAGTQSGVYLPRMSEKSPGLVHVPISTLLM